MKHFIYHLMLSALLLAGVVGIATAQQTVSTDVPRTISYQGLLTSSDGTPLTNGLYDITVTLFADEAGSQAIWQSTYNTTVLNGIFNLHLGSGTPLPAPAEMNRPLWIGTSVNGTGTMTPLTPLTSSPYALNLPDKAVTTNKLADGAVTAEKVELDYVAGLRVNGEEISGKGAILSLQSGKDIDLRYDDVTETVVIESKSASGTTDGEKGPSVQDITFAASNNWLGRNPGIGGILHPFFTVPNAATSIYNTLGGGRINNIQNNADYSTITGGWDNVIADGSDYGFIGGGRVNMIDDNSNYNCVTCGESNYVGISSEYNAIVGGQANLILDDANYNFIGSGFGHAIGDLSDKNVIAGGWDNTIADNSDFNAIGGGNTNFIAAASDYNTVGGGNTNTINPGDANTISGGSENIVGVATGGVNWATIGGGEDNQATANYATVGGGQLNINTGLHSTISGGWDNQINVGVPLATIGGGANHRISGPEATIGGGHINEIRAYVGTIAGGHNGLIGVGGMGAAIGGGQNNTVDAPQSTIGGGWFNMIGVTAPQATIAGGWMNTITAPEAAIGGGHVNRIDSYVGAISGGHDNTIGTTSEAGFIGAGRNNTVTARMGSILGGEFNLTSTSYAQSIVGFANDAWMLPAAITVPFHPAPGALTNEPLFMVGNGDLSALPLITRSNAFEVSYNGHSVVTHTNGTGAVTSAVTGGTYEDNVIYGWAEVDQNGNLICADFGIASIDHPAAGIYRITLNITQPDGMTPVVINCGAAVATLGTGTNPTTAMPTGLPPASPTDCAVIRTTNIVGNIFDVFITQPNAAGVCNQLVNQPFKFHVTGRPQ